MRKYIFLAFYCFQTIEGGKDTPFTVAERYEVLMEATGGGKVMPMFDVNDFIELVGKPLAAKQTTGPFNLVIHFTSLQPNSLSPFYCGECENYLEDLKLVIENTVQGEDTKRAKTFYVYMNFTEQVRPAFSSLKVGQVPTIILLTMQGRFNLFPGSEMDVTLYDKAAQIANWLKQKGIPIADFKKPIDWRSHGKKGFGAATILLILWFLRRYIVSKESMALALIVGCAFATSGAGKMKIRNAQFGDGKFASLFHPQGSGQWQDCCALVLLKVAFLLSVGLLNWQNSKRAFTSTLGLGLLVATYCAYWTIYKTRDQRYPYSPYHMI